jgi:hypothetical protein
MIMALDGYVNRWEQEQTQKGLLFGDYGHMIETGANQYLVQKTSPIQVLGQLGTNGQNPLPSGEGAKAAPGAGLLSGAVSAVGNTLGDGFKALLVILLNTLTMILTWIFPPSAPAGAPKGADGIVSPQ